ncbi:hypothetical protein AAE02nite_43560 [Adhaeribacter aerolatus]|uniref:Lipoprotein n=1 Tax=Adhaeribacter aerolatus TaxID=670289 RepID=A0A512B430_9BACT|nr:hypothetical protein [Adhaeribacter aerolatus]GEO06692.1 hypothetical protein AAE02nite_43560 [Adhaeribacter aerolatus]
MKKLISALGLAGGLVVLASGCTSVYMPNVPNVPMFTQKGELSAGAHTTLKGNITFNTAYAVTDHFAVVLNGSMLSSERKKQDFRHNLLEGGAGYFTSFGPEQNRVFEVYTGFGKGSSDRLEKNKSAEGVMDYDRLEGSFNKYFLQVNYSSKRKKAWHLFNRDFHLNYGTALRASYLSMTEHTLNNLAKPLEDNIFLEPIFYTRVTINPAVQLQYTTGSNFGLRNRKTLTAAYSVFSLGFVINVGGRDVAHRGSNTRKPSR